jgi:FkbM family methyltransferase
MVHAGASDQSAMGLVERSGCDQMIALQRMFQRVRGRLAHTNYLLHAPVRDARRRQVESARDSRTTFTASMPGINCQMIIDPTTYFSEVYIRGFFEPELIRYLKETLHPGMTCVDVGANVGYLTLFMAKRVGQTGRVFAFEPTSRICELLKANVSLNSCRQVVIEQAALSDHIGALQFHEGPTGFDVYNSAGTITHPTAIPQPFMTSQVRCLTLDSYLGELEWPEIDIVKIDVEGGELSVLKGMEQVLKSSPGIQLIIELADQTTHGFGYSASDIEHWLRARGWHLSIVGAGGKLFAAPVNNKWTGQNIVAYRPISSNH